MKKKQEQCASACRLSKVGGEAVIEGVMMRAGDRCSTACRLEDGSIAVVDRKFVSIRKRKKFFNIPILRGFVNFIESMVMSFGILELSAEMMGGEPEETKFEKWLKKVFGKSIYDVIMLFAGVLGIALAVVLFSWLPNKCAEWIQAWVGQDLGIWKAAISGGMRILIFIGYIALISLMRDIRRTFQYHGAEHKSIACYEAGEELTPENAKKHSRFHPRCGTSFMFVMLALSIVIALGVRALCEHVFYFDFAFGPYASLIYTGIGILTLPIVMGIGFEFLMYAGKHNGPIIRLLSAPGLWMQRLTTREPSLEQLEVALTALKCSLPEEFPEFDRNAVLVRDEYNHPPVKKKKGQETVNSVATEPKEAESEATEPTDGNEPL